MDINNNLNNYNNSIDFGKKGKPVKVDRSIRMNVLATKVKEILLEQSERRIPENGKFGKVSMGFYVPDSDNMGILYAEYDPKDPKTQRILSVGVYHKNSDRITSNIVAKGTKKEILEYLKSQDNNEELIKTIDDLSAATDEYYASL